MEKGFKKILVVVCVLFMIPVASWSAEAEKEELVKVESVTVTANKIEEDLQDIPQSITVISEDVLEEKGIKNIADVIREIPNMVSSSNSHGNEVNFRGLNSSHFTSNNPVVIYIDGVPYTTTYGFDASLANVERVEVLRGPQGTLYGKDAIGGVINIVTKDPDNKWHGKVGAEYGSFNSMRGLFNLSGPLLKDSLYMGINGQYQQDDGWIENIHSGMDNNANDKKEQRINGFILFKPTDQLSAKLSLSNDNTVQDFINGYALPGGTDISVFNRDDAENVDFDVPTRQESDSFSQSLNLIYDFKALTLTSVTTHRELDTKSIFDADLSNNPLWDGLIQFKTTERDAWNQELRLSSNNKDGFRWVGGVYYDKEELNQGPCGMQFPTAGGNYEMNSENQVDSNTKAIFGQVIWPVGRGFELTLGGRYQRIEKEIDSDTYYIPVGTTGAPMYSYQAEKTWNVFLPKIALAYGINNAWTTYVSYSEGYMPGGFNVFAMAGTPDDNSFEPQRSSNYELGIKGSLDRLQVALSLFYMDIEDTHVFKSVGTMYLTDNAKKAHSQGAELELTYRLTDTIELTGAAGIIQAEYDDYDAGGGVNYDGEKMQNTPSHTLSLGVAYFHPDGFYSRLDMKNQGSIHYNDGANNTMVKEDGYTTFDTKIGYKINNWDFYVYGKNLTDTEYINSFMSGSRTSMVELGDPRTVGIGVTYRF